MDKHSLGQQPLYIYLPVRDLDSLVSVNSRRSWNWSIFKILIRLHMFDQIIVCSSNHALKTQHSKTYQRSWTLKSCFVNPLPTGSNRTLNKFLYIFYYLDINSTITWLVGIQSPFPPLLWFWHLNTPVKGDYAQSIPFKIKSHYTTY